jgi:hypothetical protein
MHRSTCTLALLVGALAVSCAPTPSPSDAGSAADGAAGGWETESAPDGDETGSPASDGGAPGGDESFDVPAAIAEAVCEALFACCDTADMERYVAAMRATDSLAAFHDQLPPQDEASCVTTFTGVYDIAPFGGWMRAVEAGQATFVRSGFDACMEELTSASCGAPKRAALYDNTCFAFSPPVGGEYQRRMFDRTDGVGTSCAPLNDGVGAAFYGTCDPEVAFCCYENAENPDVGCAPPVDSDGNPRAGTCAAVSPVGETCSAGFPLQLCATGVICGDVSICEEESDETLSLGDVCVEGFSFLGECEDSWCDFLGTEKCEPLKAAGDDCLGGDECTTGYCGDGVCAVDEMCGATGSDQPTPTPTPTPDAGTGDDGDDDDDSSSDEMAMAAETCSGAPALDDGAPASPLGSYQHRLAGVFGASNDYNPYRDATPALPPGCSLVFDANGPEVVFAVELAPGQKIDFSYEVTPVSVPPAIYLLDGCGDTPGWPDTDESGVCGNNEYATPGFCPGGYCYAQEHSFTHPQTLGGQPTTSKTYYVVLDTVGTGGESFTLDWRVTP